MSKLDEIKVVGIIKIIVFNKERYIVIRDYSESLLLSPDDRESPTSVYEPTSSSRFYIDSIVSDVIGEFPYEFIPELLEFKANETSFDYDEKYDESAYTRPISDLIYKSTLLDGKNRVKDALENDTKLQFFQPSESLINEISCCTLTLDLSKLFFKCKKPKSYIKIIDQM